MKIVKRILWAVSALLLVFTLAGCSKSSSSSKPTQSSSASSSTSSQSSSTSSSESSDKDTRKPVKQTKYEPHIYELDIGTSSFSDPSITENGKQLSNSEEEKSLQSKLANFPFTTNYLCAIVALNKIVLMPLSSDTDNDEYPDIKRVYKSKAEFLKAYKKQKTTYGDATYTYKADGGSYGASYDFTKFKNIPFHIENDYTVKSNHKQPFKLTKVGKAKIQEMFNEWPELKHDDDDLHFDTFYNDTDLTLTDTDFTFTNGVSSKGFKIKYKFRYELSNSHLLGLEDKIKEEIEQDSNRFDD